MEGDDRQQKNLSNAFIEQAKGASQGLLSEFFDFLRYNKKWWLAPIIILLILLGLLIALGSTVMAPFIYPLF